MLTQVLQDKPYNLLNNEPSVTQHIVYSDGICRRAPYATVSLEQYSDHKLKDITTKYQLYSIHTRFLINRQLIHCRNRNIIYDVMMDRDQTTQHWNMKHIFYEEEEPSPLPLIPRKRTYEETYY